MSYDNRGKVSLWKNESDNERAPILKGSAIAHRDIKEGEVLDVALWKNRSDNPKAPALTGNLSDKKQPNEIARDRHQEKVPFDDDIPW